MVTARVEYNINPRFVPDDIPVWFGNSKDAAVIYDATAKEWTVQTTNAAGALQDRLRIKAEQDAFSLELPGRLLYTPNTFAFQEATTISTSTGNLTLSAAGGADVLIGDGATLIFVEGGAFGGDGRVAFGRSAGATVSLFHFNYPPSFNATSNSDFYEVEIASTFGPVNIPASTTSPLVASLKLDEPNISLGAGAAVTNAATLVIDTAPTEGTNNYALLIDAGRMRTDEDIEFTEMTAPAAGGVNTARLFARDNGAGKTQLAVRFNTGAIQVLATEP